MISALAPAAGSANLGLAPWSVMSGCSVAIINLMHCLS